MGGVVIADPMLSPRLPLSPPWARGELREEREKEGEEGRVPKDKGKGLAWGLSGWSGGRSLGDPG